MSTERLFVARIGGRLRRTQDALGLVFTRLDSVSVFVFVTVGYLVAFLWVLGDLSFRPDVAANLVVIDDPLSRMFDRTGPASFEAIALVDTGVVRWLAALVGVNLAMTYLAVVQPAACGIGAGSGLFASLPALLSGTVCCGPVVLIALGIQASGLLLSLFVWMLPIGVALLLGSLLYVAGKIDVTGMST